MLAIAELVLLLSLNMLLTLYESRSEAYLVLRGSASNNAGVRRRKAEDFLLSPSIVSFVHPCSSQFLHRLVTFGKQ